MIFGAPKPREVNDKNIYSTITKGSFASLAFFYDPASKTVNAKINGMLEALAEEMTARVSIVKINAVEQAKTMRKAQVTELPSLALYTNLDRKKTVVYDG
jgi:hypothetical protein